MEQLTYQHMIQTILLRFPAFDLNLMVPTLFSVVLLIIAYRFLRVRKNGVTLAFKSSHTLRWVMIDGKHSLEDLKKKHSKKYFRSEYMAYPKTVLYGILYLVIALIVFALSFIEIRI